MENVEEKKAKGLANVNSTCYINTSIQCLLFCNDFFNFIINLQFEENKKNSISYEFQSLLRSLWIDQHHIRPIRFLKFLQSHIKDMDIFSQNDINEFLHLFIDKIHNENKTLLLNYRVERPHTNNLYEKQKCKMRLAWGKSHAKSYSEIIDLFYGQLISQITCKECEKIYHIYEDYSMIHLGINDNNTLYECLDEHFKDVKIDDWNCSRCNKKTNNEKHIRLWSNPKILIISLNRFDNEMRKIRKEITIPRVLNMSKYTLCKETNVSYCLKTVACHQGTIDMGHYYAICNLPNNKWFNINDVFIQEVFEINEKDAYVLFYTIHC